MSKDILIILHQERSSPGRLGRMLEEKGYRLDIRKPRFGDLLPETMDDHKGAIIFGGPMGANDPEDFVKQEIDWCGVPLKERAPFLGICLGAQMLAKQMGAEVYTHPEGMAEVGYFPVFDVRNGPDDQVMPKAPSHFFQWHRDGFDLPTGADLIMRGDMFENQAFKADDMIFGVQFHTELNLAMHHRWIVHGAERLTMPGAQGGRAHLKGRLLYDAPIREWLDRFVDQWLAADQR